MSEKIKQVGIARRYVTAVYALLNNKERQILSIECKEFLVASEKDSNIQLFLRDPRFSWTEKQKIIIECFPSAQRHKILSNFFGLLCRKRRELILESFCEAFHYKVNQDLGVGTCVVTLARPVAKLVLEAIQQKISKLVHKKLEIETKIDASIIGGFRAAVDGTVIDATTRNQLDHLRERLVSSLRN